MLPDNLAKQDLLDLTTTGFVICILIGMVIISITIVETPSTNNAAIAKP